MDEQDLEGPVYLPYKTLCYLSQMSCIFMSEYADSILIFYIVHSRKRDYDLGNLVFLFDINHLLDL